MIFKERCVTMFLGFNDMVVKTKEKIALWKKRKCFIANDFQKKLLLN